MDLLNNLAITLQKSEKQSIKHLADSKFEHAAKLLLAMQQHHGRHTALVRNVPRLLHLAYLAQRNHSDALNSIVEWLEQLDEKKPPDRSSIAWATTSQSVCYLDLGKLAEAEKAATEALAIEEISAIERHRCNSVLGVCRAHRHQFNEAEKLVTEAYEELEAMLGGAPAELLWYVPRAAERVIQVYELAEKTEEIKAWKSKLTEIKTRILKQNTSLISVSDAEKINGIVWNKVSKPPKNSNPSLTTDELKEMRQVCKQYPAGYNYNTLGVAEFRVNNFEEAIAAAKQSIEKTSMDMPDPIDLAILAMSHHKLGDAEKANEYRQQLDDAMKSDAFKADAAAKSFEQEVAALFDVDGT